MDSLERRGKAKVLGDDGITTVLVAKHAQSLLEGASAADSLAYSPVCIWRVADDFRVLGQKTHHLR